MTKWTEDITYKFVEEYLKHECLYNCKNPKYKMKGAREAALLQLSKAINIPGFGSKEAYTKIRNLKSTYSQEVKKIKLSTKSGAGTDDVYIPHIKWFKLLNNALNAIDVQCRDLQTNMIPDSHAASTTEYKEDQTEITQKKVKARTSKVKKRRLNYQPNLSEVVEELTNTVNRIDNVIQTQKYAQEEDEYDLYGRLLAKRLRQFSKRDGQELMHEIDGLVLSRVYHDDTIDPLPSPVDIVIKKQISPYVSPSPSP